MTLALLPYPRFRATDANGLPLAGGLLYSYQATTSTPLALLTSDGSTPAQNPLVLDANGEADVRLGTNSYKLVLKTSAGATLWTIDNVSGLSPTVLGGYSATLAQMKLTTDPGELGSESLATTMAGELERLRWATYEVKHAVDGSLTQWYQTPSLHRGYNVRDYGVVADGTTDNAAALNALMTTVNAAGGGVVYFPAGTYAITTSILVPSNTMVMGEGPATMIKMATSQVNTAFVNAGYATLTANTNIVICDLAINGNRATPAGSWVSYGANIWTASTAYTSGTYVANTNGYRVYLCLTSGTSAASGGPTGTNADITDNTAHWQFVENLFSEITTPGSHQSGTLMSRVTHCLIHNVHFYMSRDNGAIFELCYDAKLIGCRMTDINKNPAYFSDNEHSTCMGNTASYSFGGFAFACEWYSSMVGNVGTHHLNYFVSVGRDCQYCSIVGNTGGTSLAGASGLSSGGDFLVVLESITGTAHGKTYAGALNDYQYGIYHSTISGNTFTRMQFEMSDGNIITNNIIHNARRDGLFLYGSNQNLVALNKVYNGGDAIQGPWALGNLLEASAGALQTNIESVQNRWLYNEVHDDRANDGTPRWGMTFTGSPTYLQVIGNVVYLNVNVVLAARFYNWNVDYGVFKDNSYGNGSGYRRFLPTSLPTAREELRGDVWTVNGGAGATDKHYICRKNASDTYEFDLLPSLFRCIGTGTATWDMTDTADAATNAVNITVAGALTTDFVLVTYDSIVGAGNFLLSGYVQSANTVRLVVMNKTGGNYNPASGNATAIVLRLT